MTSLLSFLAPGRLWLLVLIPLLVGLYLWLVQRKRNRSMQVSKTMFDLVIPRDRTWLRHLAVGLSILSLMTLTVASPSRKISLRSAGTGDHRVTYRCVPVHGGHGRGTGPAGGSEVRSRAACDIPPTQVQYRIGDTRWAQRRRWCRPPWTVDR